MVDLQVVIDESSNQNKDPVRLVSSRQEK